MLLTVFVGTGAQLLMMCFFTILFAAVGFLSPANRGSLMIAVLLTYVLMGSVAGPSVRMDWIAAVLYVLSLVTSPPDCGGRQRANR